MENKCGWINKKKEPCPWKKIGNDYCKRHSCYEDIYKPEDVPNITFCSDCKNPIGMNIINIKICDKCKERGKINREKNKEKNKENNNICIGKKPDGTPCKFKALKDDEYCKNHQTYKKWKKLSDGGNKVCKNWIRGCFEIVDEDTYSACIKCRIKNCEMDNKRHNKKVEKAKEFNKKNNDKIMCENCNDIINPNNSKNNKCLKCYNTYCKSESNRNSRDELKKKLSYIKKGAKDRNIEWNLTDEKVFKLIKSKCNYCNKLIKFNGIDRIDSNNAYTENNCVSCCKDCNYMKLTYSVDDFLKMVEYLLSINLLIDKIPNEKYSKLFKNGNRNIFSAFKHYAEKKDKSVEISKELYISIIEKNCHYCNNKFENGCNGIDRLNSSIGYIIGNIVPCCKTCNIMKNTLTKDEFFKHLKDIYNYKINKIPYNELTIKEKILQLSKVKVLEHEKFLKDKEFYENLVFNPKTFDEIKNISIKLEICNNKELKDIWNYYRRTVSSLKKLKNSKLIGRQIYILVKDNNTNKYLGIMSLSSSVQSCEDRENYIGWSNSEKFKKLNNIINLSTCVPLQPFGFNCNGGKLLASLAFSKELIVFYKDKYDDDLLAIETTSLYGKSIQYDRLKCLKMIGYTKGNSVKDISTDIVKLCSNYLKTNYGLEYPSKKKFIIIQNAFDKLEISKDEFLKSNKKGIYFGYTCYDSKDYLNNTTNIIPDTFNKKYKLSTSKEIFNWWLERWCIKRFKNKQK